MLFKTLVILLFVLSGTSGAMQNGASRAYGRSTGAKSRALPPTPKTTPYLARSHTTQKPSAKINSKISATVSSNHVSTTLISSKTDPKHSHPLSITSPIFKRKKTNVSSIFKITDGAHTTHPTVTTSRRTPKRSTIRHHKSTIAPTVTNKQGTNNSIDTHTVKRVPKPSNSSLKDAKNAIAPTNFPNRTSHGLGSIRNPVTLRIGSQKSIFVTARNISQVRIPPISTNQTKRKQHVTPHILLKTSSVTKKFFSIRAYPPSWRAKASGHGSRGPAGIIISNGAVAAIIISVSLISIVITATCIRHRRRDRLARDQEMELLFNSPNRFDEDIFS